MVLNIFVLEWVSETLNVSFVSGTDPKWYQDQNQDQTDIKLIPTDNKPN